VRFGLSVGHYCPGALHLVGQIQAETPQLRLRYCYSLSMAHSVGRRSSSSSSRSTIILDRPSQQLPWGLKWRSSTFFIIFVVGIGIFTDLFIYSIVVPVLPFLLRDRLHVPPEKLQIYVSSLLGAMAASSFVFSPIAGIIADRIGNRQQPFLAGLVALLLSTILLAVGNSVGMIVLARVLQGMSSAVVWVVGLAILVETQPAKLGTMIGTARLSKKALESNTDISQIFSFSTFGTQAAPVLGGVLYTKTGYIGVSGACLGLILIDIILRLLMIEKKTALQYRKAHETIPSNSIDETTPFINETTPDNDLVRYRLPTPSTWLTRKMPILCTFRSPALITAFFIGFVQAFLVGAYDATIPMVALEYYNFDSLHSGLLFLALGLPSLLLGPVFGWMVDRFGTRTVAVLGYGYLVPIHILLRIPRPGGADQVRTFTLILAATSVGMSAIDAPSLVEAGLVVERYHKANPEFFGENGPYAQLYGLNSMVFSLGCTVGPLLAGWLKNLWSYGNMNSGLAGICLVSAVTSWLYLGTAPKRRKERDEEEDECSVR